MTSKKKHESVDTSTGEILVGMDKDTVLADTTDTKVVMTDSKLTRFTSVYRHDKNRSKRFATANLGPSLTQQSDAAETDINVIVKRYLKTGVLPQVKEQPIYGDFTSEDLTYRDMVEKIAAANAAFMEVPADIRGRFENDPGRWIEFVNDPKNLDELRKMGLAKPEPPAPTPPEPMLVRVVPEPQPKEK